MTDEIKIKKSRKKSIDNTEKELDKSQEKNIWKGPGNKLWKGRLLKPGDEMF